MYDNQLYVQTTKLVRDALDYNEMLEAQGDDQALALPKVKWRPYYSTPSRTPIMIAHDKGEEDEGDAGSGAMALWNQYPFGELRCINYIHPFNLCLTELLNTTNKGVSGTLLPPPPP